MISLAATARDALVNNKLTRDIVWSMGSFFILAISGIVINITVAAFRDAAALGVFNLAYAVYIVASQLAIWGIHYSVLRYAAYYRDNPTERDTMFFTAVAIALVLGAIAAVILFVAAPGLGRLFQSPDAGAAMGFAAFGLLLFPLNKVLLAFLNGLREMKAFSVLQAIRYLTVMASVSAIAASSVSIKYTTLGFLIAETVTALGVGFVIYRHSLAGKIKVSAHWMRMHFKFGTKGLAGGMFAEFNSRIDVLMIGFFLTDHATGIYSFAAMLVDGLYHVIAMIRTNFNPVLVTAVKESKWLDAQNLMRQSRRYIFVTVVSLALCIALAYWILAVIVLPSKGLTEGIPSLLILLFGVSLASIFIPFDNLMVVSGHPGYQAMQQIGAVVANATIGAMLLPQIGVEGAAISTAMSYACNVVLLVVFTRRLLGWDLINNSVRQNHLMVK
ncbi:hypothetical protein ASC97_29215 [Rhizobium sp. Root1203]|uniref:oligosaccharide flippase family protein n=1 Tax=Rhizobium sp. Root1203 TaxID=1736427 RepID=UPI000708FE0D|nr:oligosaccharide flippase family protein [Rhizobium sp. Root1203]KQV19481.1 hypothetical protein ASC97_29215 [Rhizobium sp. Root1203]